MAKKKKDVAKQVRDLDYDILVKCTVEGKPAVICREINNSVSPKGEVINWPRDVVVQKSLRNPEVLRDGLKLIGILF